MNNLELPLPADDDKNPTTNPDATNDWERALAGPDSPRWPGYVPPVIPEKTLPSSDLPAFVPGPDHKRPEVGAYYEF